jgi:carboxyl-terminal processing protease
MALPLRVSDAQLIRFGNLPPMFAQIRRERREVADGCVGIIALSVWMAPLAAEVDRAVDALRDCRGIVLDLRGNPGGVAGMVMGVGGHFVDSTRALGTLRMRTNELRFVVNPRPVNGRGEQVGVYGGPLAILVDVMSASTSEIFAAGLQAIGRARVFGEVSAGQALPARATSLPNGDVLMHAIADYLVVDGSRVEGRGVLPDEVVPLRITDVMAGRDAPLDAALRWIAAEAE